MNYFSYRYINAWMNSNIDLFLRLNKRLKQAVLQNDTWQRPIQTTCSVENLTKSIISTRKNWAHRKEKRLSHSIEQMISSGEIYL